FSGRLAGDAVGTLEPEHPARIRGRSELMPEVFDDRANLANLLSVTRSEFALADPQAVFKPDPHMTTEPGAVGGELHLIAARREGGEVVLLAKKLVGDRDHVGEVLVVGADSPEDAEHTLNKEGRLREPLFNEVGEGIKVPDVVALVL